MCLASPHDSGNVRPSEYARPAPNWDMLPIVDDVAA